MFVFFLSASVVHAAFFSKENGQKQKIIVTILPLAFFVENIGKERVDVSVMIPPGGNPHTYEPTPRQLRELSLAGLYVKVGTALEFERAWMDKLISLNKKMLVCDSSRGLHLIEMDQDHGDGGEKNHHQGRYDPHVWLSPVNAVAMVINIRNCLIRIDPEKERLYTENAKRLISRLKELDQELKEKFSSLEKRSFLVFHPAWGYFARDYGLEEINVEHAAKEPTAGQIIRVIKRAREDRIRVVFVSPQFNKKSAEVIAKEIGGRVEFLDPLAEDYFKNLRRAADAFVESAQ